MKSILVPIDIDNDAEWTINRIIELYRTQPLRLVLLNVQSPLSRYVSRFINSQDISDFHYENGMRVLRPLAEKLDAAGVAHTSHVIVGHKAESIARFARDHNCDQIMLPRNRSMFHALSSIGSQLRHLIGPETVCEISEVY